MRADFGSRLSLASTAADQENIVNDASNRTLKRNDYDRWARIPMAPARRRRAQSRAVTAAMMESKSTLPLENKARNCIQDVNVDSDMSDSEEKFQPNEKRELSSTPDLPVLAAVSRQGSCVVETGSEDEMQEATSQTNDTESLRDQLNIPPPSNDYSFKGLKEFVLPRLKDQKLNVSPRLRAKDAHLSDAELCTRDSISFPAFISPVYPIRRVMSLGHTSSTGLKPHSSSIPLASSPTGNPTGATSPRYVYLKPNKALSTYRSSDDKWNRLVSLPAVSEAADISRTKKRTSEKHTTPRSRFGYTKTSPWGML